MTVSEVPQVRNTVYPAINHFFFPVFSVFFPFALPLLEAVGWTVDSKEVTDFFVNMLKKTIEERRKQPSVSLEPSRWKMLHLIVAVGRSLKV